MQEREQLSTQVLHILQQIDRQINRKEFCEIHGISESKLSRIMAGKIQPDFELLDYLAMHANFTVKIVCF